MTLLIICHFLEERKSMSRQAEVICHCEAGRCLTMDCPCFQRGRTCGEKCKCERCANRDMMSSERMSAVQAKLSEDPTAFTREDQIDREESASIYNFAVLSYSIDSEPFIVTPKISNDNQTFSEEAVKKAMRSIISSPAEKMRGVPPERIEEEAEKCISSEFEAILDSLLKDAG